MHLLLSLASSTLFLFVGLAVFEASRGFTGFPILSVIGACFAQLFILVLYGISEFFRRLWHLPSWGVFPIAFGWQLIFLMPAMYSESPALSEVVHFSIILFSATLPFGIPFVLYPALKKTQVQHSSRGNETPAAS